MQLATGGTMLNFGYWSSKHLDPISAQENLCDVFGNLSELSTAKMLLMLEVDYLLHLNYGEILILILNFMM